jgi:hypothetical protein
MSSSTISFAYLIPSTFNNNVGIGKTATATNALDVSGNVAVNGNVNIDSGLLFIDGSNNRVGIAKTNPSVTLDVSGVISATTVSATTLTGTLSTAAQTNITSVGSLSSLTVAGSTTFSNLSTHGSLYLRSVTTGSQYPAAGSTFLNNGEIIGPYIDNNARISFMYRYSNGIRYLGSITNTGSYFTGQHFNYSDSLIQSEDIDNYTGLIVSSSGKYEQLSLDSTKYLCGKDAITINNSLPKVDVTNKLKDKSVFGVITNSENMSSHPDYRNDGGDHTVYGRIRINSVGEGAIWVCDANGTLENGDYVTSSTISGYGIKQDDDLLHNYTVAKITCNCDFEQHMVEKKIKKTKLDESDNIVDDLDQYGNTQYIIELDELGNPIMAEKFKLRYLLPDTTQISKEEYDIRKLNGETVYRACFVGCTYHCG